MKRIPNPAPPVNQPALHVLLALGTEAKHGYRIMQDIAKASDGAIQLLPGTLYNTVKRLLAEGLIEEVSAPKGEESDDGRRRYYRVTRLGRRAAEAETRRLATLVRLGQVFLG